jgi:hypothetical protein
MKTKQPSDAGREICAFRNRVRRYGKTRKQQRKAARRRAITDSRDN